MSKIGRNSPCPCGSGKKFKHCCLKNEVPTEITDATFEQMFNWSEQRNFRISDKTFLSYIKNHESGHILDVLIELQLTPENHGKNLRIEQIAKLIIKNLNSGEKKDTELLVDIIKKGFPKSHLEDPPEGLFTENVIFHGGNYIVMPGISTKSVDIFATMSKAVFLSNTELSEEFKEVLRQGITLMLELGKLIFNACKLKANDFVESISDSLYLPQVIYKNGLDKEMVLEVCGRNGINEEVLKFFIVDANDPGFESDDYEDNPLLFRPLVLFENKYYFALISSQMLAVNEYIVESALKHKKELEVLIAYHQVLFNDVLMSCRKLGWSPKNIGIVRNPENLPIKQEVLQFDDYYLCYLVYIYPQTFGPRVDPAPDSMAYPEYLETSIKELHKREDLRGFNFLVLYVTGEIGRDAYYSFPRPQFTEQVIYFSAYEFIHLANAEQWKPLDLFNYAKAYGRFAAKTKILDTASIDTYAIFKLKGESFYLNDSTQFSMLSVVPGSGADLYRSAKQKRNIHGAITLHNLESAYESVERFRDYESVYLPIHSFDRTRFLVECSPTPIWLVGANEQSENSQFFEMTLEAVAAWLEKLSRRLYTHFETAGLESLEIQISIDPFLFGQHLYQDLYDPNLSDEFEFVYKGRIIEFFIPPGIFRHLTGSNNRGERMIMFSIVEACMEIPGFDLSYTEAQALLDEIIPLGPGKMIMILDTNRDFRLDNRWLKRTHLISEAVINMVQDDLVRIVNYPFVLPASIKLSSEKVKFCNYVVSALIKFIRQKADQFDQRRLIARLLELNESLIHRREISKIKLPAQLHCNNDKEAVIKKLLQNENAMVITSLACKSLIELFVACPTKGTHDLGYVDMDYLLAVMNEVLAFGMVSDCIHFKLDDPIIGLLPSGRIQIGKSFFDTVLKPFSEAKSSADIDYYIETFDDVLDKLNIPDLSEINEYWEPVNKAFKADFGFDYTATIQVCGLLIKYAIENNASVLFIERNMLIGKMRAEAFFKEEYLKVLEWLILDQRNDFLKAPAGYKNEDVFPWKYNREFSIRRRPLLKLVADEKDYFIYGMRNVEDASKAIHGLLLNGRLKYVDTTVSAILGTFREARGKEFRNEVVKWLKKHTNFKVWDYEVKMKPNGHLKCETDLGDIDVLAFDESDQKVYSIECKRTHQARNMHEMKVELDAYLGREGQKRNIQRHLDRHNWIIANKKVLGDFIGTGSGIKVSSLILTSEVLPIKFIAGDKLPLPFVFWPELKRAGIPILP
ncbi:MAG: SEC-C domain-containing protein [Chitinophagaceae bacterium]|nr:SEC-C domain-containing protein [Chitinophagaceae bacterium]